MTLPTYDIQRVEVNSHPNKDGFCPMEIEGNVYTEKKAAGSAILEACRAMKSPDPVPLGKYRGFAMELYFDPLSWEYKITLIGSLRHTATLGTDDNIQRLDNTLESLPSRLQNTQDHLSNTRRQLEEAKAAVDKPFSYVVDCPPNPPASLSSMRCIVRIVLKMKTCQRSCQRQVFSRTNLRSRTINIS